MARRIAGKLCAEQLEVRQMLAADAAASLDQVNPLAGEEVSTDIEAIVATQYSADGGGNNLSNADWGAAGEQLLRLTAVEYADGASDPAGEGRPSAREVSNAVAAQEGSIENERLLTDFVWLWGQFVDHDIDLSVHAEPTETFAIEVPAGDEYFDPTGTGEATISLTRSDYVVDEDGVRQQVNSITSYLDGSVVYGSDQATADSLRTFDGGKLRTSDGDLLPIGEDGFFEAGDVRANENVALTSMHTLWVREHNRLADEIAAADPSLSDEQIYQEARAIVVAEIQAITYNQWLPALLGVDAISQYSGYDPSVNASIANVFSTAAYRFGHSMLSTELLRMNQDGSVIDGGNLSLSEAFFSPQEILDHGVDSLLMGATAQLAQEIDSRVVDDVRNFLFGPPGAGGFDLVSLNIQRGRDHGLADYNQTRVDYGLSPVSSFSEITSDAELAAKLEQLYGDVDNIDVWVGVLAEDHVPGSSLGELGRTILVDQFERIRDGDRLWYQNIYSGEELAELENLTLSDVLMRNTELTDLRDNVFYDESVFYFAAPAGLPPLSARLTVRGDQLRLVDTRTGAVLQSAVADEVSKVVLVGGDVSPDAFVVDANVAELQMPGGIVIDGQGGRDTLAILGVRPGDAVDTDSPFMQVGGMELQVDEVEVVDAQGPQRRVPMRPAPRPDRPFRPPSEGNAPADQPPGPAPFTLATSDAPGDAAMEREGASRPNAPAASGHQGQRAPDGPAPSQQRPTGDQQQLADNDSEPPRPRRPGRPVDALDEAFSTGFGQT